MKTLKLIAVATALLIVPQAYCQIKSGDNIIVSERTDHDLYLAAGNVTVNAPVDGDLIVAGGTIVINDSIRQDILITGGDIVFNGFVGDDIRCAGGTIQISNSVLGDVVAAGGEVIIDDDAVIHGDLFITGGEITLDGKVNGMIRCGAGTFTLNGRAGSNLDCRGGKIVINGIVEGNSSLAAKTIQLGNEASFGKDVKYWNKAGSLDFGNKIRGGQAIYDPSLQSEGGKWHYLGFASFLMLLWYLSTALLMIILIQYLFSKTFRTAAHTIKNASMKSLGIGFLFLIGVPIAIIVSFVSIIGLPIGVLLLVGYTTVLLFGTVIVSLLIASWISNTYYESSWTFWKIVLVSFGVFIFLKLASLTPVVGPLIMLLLICMAFGGILQHVRWKKNKALELT
ncbi:MAG TPA: polymer-forming cytoskeletal protein [Cyclobacteriaceae bacterium]|nr:polymer-forming cytoskeletal protein [Cyclobacteriaceae bacterium]